jgi:serine/threonine-protein kinase
VHGQDPGSAGSALGASGLKTKTSYESSATVAQGSVTRTDPPAGTLVSKGTTVTIFVSTGAPTTTSSSTTSTSAGTAPVPDVKGQLASDAAQTLQAAGFTPVNGQPGTVPQGCGTTYQSGTVSRQSPGAGTVHTKGSNVTLNVCP